MAGQIIPRGKRNFIVRVYMGRDSVGGRKYLNETVRGTKKEAQALLNKLLRDKDMGMLIEPARMSTDEYLKHWLTTSVKPRVRARTYGEYESTLKRYVTKRIGALPLGSVKSVDIQKVYSEMQEEGRAAWSD